VKYFLNSIRIDITVITVKYRIVLNILATIDKDTLTVFLQTLTVFLQLQQMIYHPIKLCDTY